ncbi:V-type ATP synthase subunit B [Photobacterium sp.]|uniref:V-type ATP synthase subunit B n=1 Tax=Photobacterium sp. TaxID=660 RepID=UPI00299EDF71|nr:V-type ATP synthase subunit B [Photobacterium sp.]MDX1301475.1 V-type ATP synthase subunit B [Photobacterium sp.]
MAAHTMKDPIIYTQLEQIEGPLIALVAALPGIGFGEAVQVADRKGRIRHGRVAQLDGDKVMIEVFQGTTGLAKGSQRIRFLGHPITLTVSESIIGRRLNGVGDPIDGGPPLTGVALNINGNPLNPTARAYPHDFIQTGIAGIDAMNALVRGQKLPIFSSSGLPHDQLAIQIAQQARIRPDLSNSAAGESSSEELVVVFAAIGIKHDVAVRFAEEISGRTVSFLNLADDPVMERLLTPRVALTAAEYLAFELGLHVLVILTDMTIYGEALREIATARGDIPSRKGYPGYLYSDLATIFERAGRIKDKSGSITQIPILTMPSNDITHPIPDLTGYITEGQIVLSRDLFRQRIYPPINLPPSLSRLMADGVGQGLTRGDHQPLMEQLYAAYARTEEVRMMTRIVGEGDLSSVDRCYLEFGKCLEQSFIAQDLTEDRSIEESLDIGWRVLGCLPREELSRLSATMLETHGTLLNEGLDPDLEREKD